MNYTPDMFDAPVATNDTQSRYLYRLRVVREAEIQYGSVQVMRKRFERSGDVFEMFREYCNALDREELQVLALDIKSAVIGWHTMSIGTLNSAITHPRDVFKFALLANAASIIILHNHPSGDPTPSDEDILITARLVEAGKMLGIPITDHVICGERTHYSFCDQGRLR